MYSTQYNPYDRAESLEPTTMITKTKTTTNKIY